MYPTANRRPRNGVARLVVRLAVERRHVVGPEHALVADLGVGPQALEHVGRPVVVERLDEVLRRAAHVAEVDEVDRAGAAEARGSTPGRSSVMSAKFPWHIVIPLASLGTSSRTRSNASTLRMIRPRPRTGEIGGSSGCSASRTPAFSATGTTRRRKYSKFSHSAARSARSASGRGGAALIAAWSYSVDSAPPRAGTARPVRAQL